MLASKLPRPAAFCNLYRSSSSILTQKVPSSSFSATTIVSRFQKARCLSTIPTHSNPQKRAFSSLPSSPPSPEPAAFCKGTSSSAQLRQSLDPIPYIFLPNLPYNESLELQNFLVDRQIRLRTEQQQHQRLLQQQHQESGESTETSITKPVITTTNDVLLLVEHQPTFTNGRRNKGLHGVSVTEKKRLEDLGALYVETQRGGEITFHGEGQLVVYPILDLKPMDLSVRCYVSFLEKSIIETCNSYGIPAKTTEHTGVWVSDHEKIAAIGVHVQRYITSHGLALNCDTDLKYFNEIVACGLEGKETTTMAQEIIKKGGQEDGKTTTVQGVIPTFLKGFEHVFDRRLVPIEKVNPALEREILEFVKA